MKNAVIYARYSSQSQKDASIDAQLRECRAYALKNNYNIVNTYIDRALTGKTSSRPGFLSMIHDAKFRQFDYVIVYQLDRFMRNRKEAAIYRLQLELYKIKLISIKEDIPETPAGILLEAVLEGVNEFMSADSKIKVERGMKENALKAESTGGRCPLGYKVEKLKYVIDDLTSPYVREIFNMYAAGYMVKDIVKYLNANGIKTTHGNKFIHSSIWTILRNEKYIGVYKWNDIRIENAIPAIVEKNIFEEVQKMLDRNKKMPAASRLNKYLLTGKLVCGECGETMHGEHGTSRNGSKHLYYTCHARKQKRICTAHNVKRDELEQIVYSKALEILNDEESINMIAEQLVNICAEHGKNDSLLLALQDEFKEVCSKIDNLLKLAERGIQSDEIVNRIASYTEIKKQLEIKITRAELLNNPLMLTKSHVCDFLHNVIGINTETHEKHMQHIINIFINQVVLFNDKIIIKYNYSNASNDFKTLEYSGSSLYDMVQQKHLCAGVWSLVN